MILGKYYSEPIAKKETKKKPNIIIHSPTNVKGGKLLPPGVKRSVSHPT